MDARLARWGGVLRGLFRLVAAMHRCLTHCSTFSSKVIITTLATMAFISLTAVTSVAEVHRPTRAMAERYLTRDLSNLKAIVEDPDDPIVPTATTTVTDMAVRCVRPRSASRHRHRMVCGYLIRVMVHPNPGSSEQHRVLVCGDLKVFVEFRAKGSRRLKVVGNRFRCRVVANEGGGPPGAPEAPGGTPPGPPSTGPPPPS
jgi:hypothetical protein